MVVIYMIKFKMQTCFWGLASVWTAGLDFSEVAQESPVGESVCQQGNQCSILFIGSKNVLRTLLRLQKPSTWKFGNARFTVAYATLILFPCALNKAGFL